MNSPDRPLGASLVIENVTKTYGDVRAVSGVSLSVEPGEFITLLGASGSGKTTLLRVISGFLAPDSGRLLLNGKDITSMPVHKRNMGMVFQSYALFPHYDVLRNVAFPLRMRKVRRAERERLALDALAAVDLAGYERRRPSELSGGQQQRVALARAIVARPGLILMDEPLGALDRRLRESLQLEILKLSRELGLTVINVTHDQEEAFTLSDRIAFLAHGDLIQYSSPEDMYLSPNSELTAQFMGESNSFRGRLCSNDDGITMPLKNGVVRVPGSVVCDLDMGDEHVVVVRPWDIRLDPNMGDAPPADRSYLDGVVEAVIFAGESRKIVIRAIDGRSLIVRSVFDAHDHLTAETPIRATWLSEACIVTSATAVTTNSDHNHDPE